MNTKEKSKRGKAIIGIAMAAIMVASVIVAMVPSTVAIRGTLGEINPGDVVYRTDDSSERELNVTAIIPTSGVFYGITGSDAEGEIMTVDDSSCFSVPVTAKLGLYNASGPEEGNDIDLIVAKAEIIGSVFINDFGDSIVGGSVPVGTEIQIRASPTFGGILKEANTNNSGNITIELTPPESVTRDMTVLANASDIDVTLTQWDELNTTGWKTGTATVKIKSVKSDCNGLDVSSAVYEFTVISEKLTITAEKDDVGKGERVILTISGTPSTWYYFAIENVANMTEPKVEDTTSVWPVAGESNDADKPCAAWVKTKAGGTREVEVSTTGADDRTYTMHVYYGFDDITWAAPNKTKTFKPADAKAKNPEDYDDVKVKVREADVTFDIPTTAIIGEDVTIKGTVTAGDKVDILIEDGKLVEDRWDDEPVDGNDEFEVKWSTDEKMTGTYSIDVYIDCDLDAESESDVDDVADLDEDGRTTIRLVEPGLTAEQLRNVVAEGDDYTIEGTATGVDTVDIVLIGPKGFMADAYSVIDGLLITSTSVTDNEFSEDLRMTDGLDTGQWMAVVLFPGRDGKYGSGDDGITAGNLADGAETYLSLKGKTRDQIIAILTDYTIEQAGSDDDLKVFTFKVESGYIDLNPVETVAIGEPLNLTGVTNREPETLITISTFAKPAGATDLPAVLAEVEWSTKDEGVFSGTIDTTDAVPGTYTLEADDGDGNTDSITVEIVEEIVPIATPTPAPTAEPTEAPAVPTPEPTAEPTPTPEEPGFEAVFAIAGLLSIAYLVLRKRK